MEGDKCVFCLIASKAIKSTEVYEDDNILAVLDINPATKGHTIVIPKVHYSNLYEIPNNEFLGMLSVTRALMYALMLSQGATNVDMLYTQELAKGNFSPHALLHLLPRYKEDTVNYVWQPEKPSPEEMLATQQSIQSAISNVSQEKQAVPPPPQPVQQAPPQPPKQEPKPEPKKEEKPQELKKRTIII